MHPSKQASQAKRARPLRAAGPQQRVGAWQLDSWLGEGRWTRVYRARAHNECGNADYAVKLLKPECARDPLAIGLLQREAQVARELSHPNLLSILASHVDGPPFFLVSPYLEGATLQQTIRGQGRLSTPHALWIARQVSEGLRAMHAAGWLHGDIKPENIYVTRNGHATVCDLGLARHEHQTSSSDRALAGTPAYLAPEALSSHLELSPASDVFSLGVTLFEALTGQLPFPHEDPLELAEALLTHPAPNPRRLAADLPVSVTRLLRRMLAKTPLRRPNVEELIPWLVDLEIETFDDRLIG
jgi:serine/threonine-protein kinase